MRGSTQQRPRPDRRLATTSTLTGDAGFTLVEGVVAAAILVLLAVAVLGLLGGALATTQNDRQRVAAANLAARELEIVRNEFANSEDQARAIADSGTTVDPHPLSGTGPLVVDGTPYTVTRDVQWMVAGPGASACDGGSTISFPSLGVTVTVTWPNMRGTKPVASRTILTPTKDMLADTGDTYLAVKVLNAAGGRVSALPVGVTGPGGSFTHTTDLDGCAVFQVTTAGRYTVTLNQPGWVDFAGQPVSTEQQDVGADSLARMEMSYDQGVTLVLTPSAPAGYQLPSPLPPVVIANANMPPPHQTLYPITSGTSVTATPLWPFPDGYSAWAGSCAGADPAGSPVGGSRDPATVVAPGGAATVAVRLAPLDVTVTAADGTPAAGLTVTATSGGGGCSHSDGTLILGTTDSAGVLKAAVPFGAWTLTAGNASSAPFVTVASGATAVSVAGA